MAWRPPLAAMPGSARRQAAAGMARLSGATQARPTQIMNLLNLAPDVQEETLFLPRVAGQRHATAQTRIRRIAAEAEWRRQPEAWEGHKPRTQAGRPKRQLPGVIDSR